MTDSKIHHNLVKKLKNIDGKVLGKDGKPMRIAKRNITFVEINPNSESCRYKGDNPNLGHVDSYLESGVELTKEKGCYDSGEVMESKEKQSYATVLKTNQGKQSARVREMHNHETVVGAHVVLPLEAVQEVQSRFQFTLYGYFIGKRLAFPLVENYVKNAWAKFGIKRTMLDGDFFLFQFDSKEGMEKVLEGGPWMIRLMPLIINMWNPNTILKKEEIKAAPVWVKLYNVPIVAYSETGLSLISSKIGKPILFDSYTSSMCQKSWGRKEYARVLIEFSAENEFMDEVVIAIPSSEGAGHTLATVKSELEWNPPRCAACKLFDHDTESCPLRADNGQADQEKKTEFVEVKRKRHRNKRRNTNVEGIRLSKPKPNFVYRQVGVGSSSKTAGTWSNKHLPVHNSFKGLSTDVDGPNNDTNTLNESDSGDDDEIIMEDPKDSTGDGKGASTSNVEEPNV